VKQEIENLPTKFKKYFYLVSRKV